MQVSLACTVHITLVFGSCPWVMLHCADPMGTCLDLLVFFLQGGIVMGRLWFVICCVNGIDIGYLGKCWKSNVLGNSAR